MKYAILLTLLLAGCSEPMSNKEVVDAIHECKALGYEPIVMYQGLILLMPHRVTCDFSKEIEK